MSHTEQQPFVRGGTIPVFHAHRNWFSSKPLKPQTEQVLRHLRIAGSITNVEAHTVLKVRSVSSRITELRDAGYRIHKTMLKDTTGQKYIRYSLYE